jgi:hypothetical protein
MMQGNSLATEGEQYNDSIKENQKAISSSSGSVNKQTVEHNEQ